MAWGVAPGGGTTTCSQALGISPRRRTLCCAGGGGEHFEGLELLWSFTELTNWQQAVRGAPDKSKVKSSQRS